MGRRCEARHRTILGGARPPLLPAANKTAPGANRKAKERAGDWLTPSSKLAAGFAAINERCKAGSASGLGRWRRGMGLQLLGEFSGDEE